MNHKNFNLTKLKSTSAGNFVLAGFGFAFFWSILFRYILPMFIDFFSNTTIVFLEEIIYPIGSIVPLVLFGCAFFVWIAKKFNSKDKKVEGKNETIDMAKKPLKFPLVRRPETKDKWWHRLALVLIYGSTIVGAIFFGVLLVTEESDNWAKYSYTAYSFEEGYLTAKGKEIDCKFPVTSLGDLPLISIFHCGDFSSDSEFLEMYSHTRGTYDRLQELREEKAPSLSFSKRKLQYSELSSIQKNRINNEIMVELIQSGEMDDVKVKRVLSFDYASFLGNWGLYLLLIFGWIVFWETIIYRTLLYIVFGRQL